MTTNLKLSFVLFFKGEKFFSDIQLYELKPQALICFAILKVRDCSLELYAHKRICFAILKVRDCSLEEEIGCEESAGEDGGVSLKHFFDHLTP